MSKVELNTVTNAQNISTINDNFTKIEDALNNKVLFRDNPAGEPNALVTDVDANSKRIYNLPQPISPTEPLRLGDALDNLNITVEMKAQNIEVADPNTIDWYVEVGEYAPVMRFGTSTSEFTSTNRAQAQRVGNWGHSESSYQINTLANPYGALSVSPLPWTAASTVEFAVGFDKNSAAGGGGLYRAQAIGGTKGIRLTKYDSESGTYLPVTDYDVRAGTTFSIQGSYPVTNTPGGETLPPLPTIPYYWKTFDTQTILAGGAGSYIMNIREMPIGGQTRLVGAGITADADRGYIVSADNGRTWTLQRQLSWFAGFGNFRDIQFVNGYYYVFYGNVAVAVTTDLNTALTNITYGTAVSGFPAKLFSIDNAMYLTTTGGQIYKAPANPTQPWVLKWTHPNGSGGVINDLVKVGNAIFGVGATSSTAARSTDNGETFTNVTTSGLSSEMATVSTMASDGTSLIGIGGTRIVRSLDNGTTWTRLHDVSTGTYTGWFSTPEALTFKDGMWLLTYAGGNGATGFIYSTDTFATLQRRNYSVNPATRLYYLRKFGDVVLGVSGNLGSNRNIFYAPTVM